MEKCYNFNNFHEKAILLEFSVKLLVIIKIILSKFVYIFLTHI